MITPKFVTNVSLTSQRKHAASLRMTVIRDGYGGTVMIFAANDAHRLNSSRPR